MMPTAITNTLNTVSQDLYIKLEQTMRKLDIYGVSDYKVLAMMFLLMRLLNDPNINEETKIRLNYKLIQIKNIKLY